MILITLNTLLTNVKPKLITDETVVLSDISRTELSNSNRESTNINNQTLIIEETQFAEETQQINTNKPFNNIVCEETQNNEITVI
jgi:hypothetical protein